LLFVALALVLAGLFLVRPARSLARYTRDAIGAVQDSSRVRRLSKGNYTNLIFLHHSTGENLIQQGLLRERLGAHGLTLWDHGYNAQGLRDPGGNPTGYSYNIPDDNTDPEGLARLFNQRRIPLPLNALSGLLQHEVVIFKSCFDPTSRIESDEKLVAYKEAYYQVRLGIQRHPETLFILLTQPPLNPAETDPAQAARARALADWLVSPEFQGGVDNLVVFDLFDQLAEGDPNAPDANMLRADYRTLGDSHPNRLANERVAPQLADFIVQAVQAFRQRRAASPTE